MFNNHSSDIMIYSKPHCELSLTRCTDREREREKECVSVGENISFTASAQSHGEDSIKHHHEFLPAH